MIRLSKAQFYFTFIIIELFLAGCLYISKNNSNQIHISGQIINPISDNIKFESADSIFTVELNQEGNFSFSFTTDSSLYLSLSHGEYTSMYVKPRHIVLSLNTDEFDEMLIIKAVKPQTSWQNI